MRLHLLSLGVIAILFTACSGARSPEERAALETAGAAIYTQHCQQCHPDGGAGEGPSLTAPRFMTTLYMRAKVRGGDDNMPAFGEDQISDADLDALIAQIRALRRAAR